MSLMAFNSFDGEERICKVMSLMAFDSLDGGERIYKVRSVTIPECASQ